MAELISQVQEPLNGDKDEEQTGLLREMEILQESIRQRTEKIETLDINLRTEKQKNQNLGKKGGNNNNAVLQQAIYKLEKDREDEKQKL